MELKDRLENIIAKWNLLNHPFYQAWSNGTLPTEALKKYAVDYGSFISVLPEGWVVLNDEETVEEEKEHFEMWEDFAKSLGVEIDEEDLSKENALTKKAKRLFQNNITSMGAMYAFEVQQPATASSKLEGLQKHYSDLNPDHEYFKVHSHNEHESEKLYAMISTLSEPDQEKAIAACGEMCEALWNELSTIYEMK